MKKTTKKPAAKKALTKKTVKKASIKKKPITKKASKKQTAFNGPIYSRRITILSFTTGVLGVCLLAMLAIPTFTNLTANNNNTVLGSSDIARLDEGGNIGGSSGGLPSSVLFNSKDMVFLKKEKADPTKSGKNAVEKFTQKVLWTSKYNIDVTYSWKKPGLLSRWGTCYALLYTYSTLTTGTQLKTTNGTTWLTSSTLDSNRSSFTVSVGRSVFDFYPKIYAHLYKGKISKDKKQCDIVWSTRDDSSTAILGAKLQ